MQCWRLEFRPLPTSFSSWSYWQILDLFDMLIRRLLWNVSKWPLGCSTKDQPPVVRGSRSCSVFVANASYHVKVHAITSAPLWRKRPSFTVLRPCSPKLYFWGSATVLWPFTYIRQESWDCKLEGTIVWGIEVDPPTSQSPLPFAKYSQKRKRRISETGWCLLFSFIFSETARLQAMSLLLGCQEIIETL